MKNKKISRIITIIIISIIILTGLIIFALNFTTNDTSYSIIEKKWITDNKTKVIDVNVYNDVPVYGYNGTGIIFDLINNFSKDNNINFNKISYYTNNDIKYSNLSFRILNPNEKMTSKDILMYEDNYVILSLNNTKLTNTKDIKKIGINSNDKENILYYLNDNVEFIEYKTDNNLITALINKEVDYIAVANMLHMDDIIKNNLNIIYKIPSLSLKYILRVEDETLYTIMNKYYNNYLESSFNTNYSTNYLNLYFDSKATKDIDRKNYNNKIYKYGYVINMPYENNDNNNFVGTISNYLHNFEKIFNIEIEVTKYNTIDELKQALINKEVDFALTNFNYQDLNMNSLTTDYITKEQYVVISKDNINANSIKDFKDKTINVVGSSYLYNLLNNSKINTKIYKDTDDLLRNADSTSTIIMDYQTYLYYKDTKLKDYKIVYQSYLDDGYRFIFNKDNETLEELTNYYINSSDYNNIKYNYNTNISIDKDYSLYKIITLTITIVLILLISIIIYIKYMKKDMNKDERMKYIDPLTSLKNRNYLNQNIDKWDDNVIFPQAVIMLDINRLREINDTQGRQIGDEVVKKIASVLINSQKENTDILRSSGDEFLIYMVGYEENEVKEYIKELSKKMKNIPHSYGCEFGYSMIYDEIKIVDDAINEALIMMIENKDKK